MERTKYNIVANQRQLENRLQTLSTLVSRAQLGSRIEQIKPEDFPIDSKIEIVNKKSYMFV